MEKYKIIFYGEVQKGHDLLSVKSRLAALFKVRRIMVDKLFQETPVLVRTDLQLETALSFKKDFERTGARCQMLEISAQPQAQVGPTVPAVAKIPPNAAAKAQQPPSSFPSSSPSSSAAVNRQFTYRTANPVREKKKPSVILVTVVIVFVTLIVISFLKKSNTESPPASPRQTHTRSRLSLPSEPPGSVAPSRAQSDTTRGLLSENTILFNDPKSFYDVYLPEGFTIENKSSGERSKIIYSYSDNTSVTIIASPMNKPWDPRTTMAERVKAIQEGSAGELSSFNLDGFGLVDFNGMDGYEIVLSGEDQLLHAYALVSRNNIAFSISIASLGGHWKENHDILNTAIRGSLNYRQP